MALLLPFLPLLIRSLGVTDDALVQRWSGVIFAAPFLLAAIMTPLWGWLGDRVGRKIMVIRALVGLAVSMVLMSFATTPAQLLFFRAIQGTISGFIPAAIALVSSTTPKKQQGYALGVLSSAQAGGVVVGPLIGGFLADWVGYHVLFYITAGFELLAALLVVFLVQESNRSKAQEATPTWSDNLRVARSFPIPVALLGMMITQLSIFLVQPFFALYVESFGVEPESLSSTTGLLFGVTGLTMFFAAPLSGRFSDRFGRRRTLILAFSLNALVFGLQGLAQHLATLFVLRALQGICVAAMIPGLYAIIAHHTPSQQRGGIMAFGSSATLIGGLLGPLIGGIAASTFGMRPVFWVATVLLLLNAINALRLPLDRKPRPPRALRSWEL